MGHVSHWEKVTQDDHGAMAVLVAVFLMIFFGGLALAADVGQLALWKVRAANAADAAALAGAHELCGTPDNAFNAAVVCGQANGIAPEKMYITVSDAVTVDIEWPVDFAFASLLGSDTGTVHAHAKATIAPISGVQGVAPLAVPDQVLNYGELYKMKVSHWQDGGLGHGEFGALSLGGCGADDYRENLKNGYSGVLKVGDVVPTESGNMSGPTQEAIAARFARCKDGCSFGDFTPDCPRILIVPIYEPVEGHKYKEVKIKGFAAFWVENIPGNGQDSTVEGRFIRNVTGGAVDPEAKEYGLYGVQLIE